MLWPTELSRLSLLYKIFEKIKSFEIHQKEYLELSKMFELSRNRTCIKSLEDFCLIRWTISSSQLLYEIYTKKTIEETLIF